MRHLGLDESKVAAFECTVEHLIARHNGGTDDFENLAVACFYCNHWRHRHPQTYALTAVGYRAYVVDRVHRDQWHHSRLVARFHKLLATVSSVIDEALSGNTVEQLVADPLVFQRVFQPINPVAKPLTARQRRHREAKRQRRLAMQRRRKRRRRESGT